MLERSHLALLQALERCGTLALAAEHLCLSQSALSHAIHKLERHYGVRIWHKEGRQLRLSQAGLYLLEVGARVLPQFEDADAALRRFAAGKQGLLRIGMECHPCYEWLVSIVRPFLDRWPHVDLDVVQQFRFNGLQALGNHQVDVVITSDPIEQPSFVNLPIFAYELVLVSAEGWGQTRAAHIEAPQLADQTLLSFPVARDRLDVFTQFLLPAQVEPQIHKTVETTEIMLQLVAAGRGVCTLPDWLAQRYVQQHPLRTWRLGARGVHKWLHLVVRKNDVRVNYIQDFVRIAQQPAD